MSTDTFIALLLVSTFATVGIVTTLAARSPRHWFLRTAVVVMMLAPLLAIPAPELNRYAWQSLVLMGVGSGLCVLMATARWPRWYWRLPAIVVASLLFGLVFAWYDWFVSSFAGGNWPPTNSNVLFRVSTKVHPITAWLAPIAVWLAICPATTAVVSVWLAVQGMAGFANRDASGKTTTGRIQAVFVALTIMITLLPATVLLLLLTPGADPRQRLPSPNAYDAIVEAAGAVHGFGFSGYESTPEGQLAMSVIRIERPLDTLQAALDGESGVRLDISPSDKNAMHMGVPNLARALLARGWLDRLEGRHHEAFQSYLDAIRLGYAVRSGGTPFHASIGRDASQEGAHQLYRYRHTLSADQCRNAVAALLDWESNAESVEQVNARGRAWGRIALGWHGHLRQLAADVSGMSRRVVNSERNSSLLNRAVMRLLIVELALEACRLEHGEVPATLSGLVPEFLPAVPLDPFDDAGGELIYMPTEDGYVLYSLGGNRRDDGGAPPVDGSTVKGSKGTGDLQLRVIFDDVANQAGVQPNRSPPASMFRRHR